MRKYRSRVRLTPQQIQEIKEKMQARDIELGALSERFGVTASVLGTYINGRVQIPSLIYERLQKILNLKTTLKEGNNE